MPRLEGIAQRKLQFAARRSGENLPKSRPSDKPLRQSEVSSIQSVEDFDSKLNLVLLTDSEYLGQCCIQAGEAGSNNDVSPGIPKVKRIRSYKGTRVKILVGISGGKLMVANQIGTIVAEDPTDISGIAVVQLQYRRQRSS